MLQCSSCNGDHMPPPILILACVSPHYVLQANTKFEDMFGFRAAELQRLLRNITGPKTDAKTFRSLISNGAREQQSENLLVLYRKDGHELPCRLNVYPSEHEGESTTTIEFNPITKQSERREKECDLDEQIFDQKMSSQLSLKLVTSSLQQGNRTQAVVDPAVLLHMKAVQRAAKASRRKQQLSASHAM